MLPFPIDAMLTISDLKLLPNLLRDNELTHWGRVTHICVGKLTIIGSDNGLSPERRQAIIWTNVGILLIRPLGTNFSEFLVEILIFSFKKMRLKLSSAKWRPFCLGLNELRKHTACNHFIFLLHVIIDLMHRTISWQSQKSECVSILNLLSIQAISPRQIMALALNVNRNVFTYTGLC